ncbi:hypothetical protein ATERTT37_007097 [Aspergillus terreus]
MQAAESKTAPVMLSDWRKLTSTEIWAAEEATGLDAYCANALLINGKGSIDCLSQEKLDKFTTAGQREVLGNNSHFTDIGAIVPSMYHGCTPSRGACERLLVDPADSYVSYDLVSAAGINTVVFSIDEHPMYVYAIDGRYIVPTLVDAITLANGNRYSVMVKLDRPAGDYTIRLATTGVNQILGTTAILSYGASFATEAEKRFSVPSIDIAGTLISANYTALNESTIIPFPAEIPSYEVTQTYVLDIDHYHASYRWTLGNSSLPMILEESTPLLFDPSAAQRDLSIETLNGTWVDLIFRVVKPLQPPHPFHKHSNKFFVIGQGNGYWNYSSVAEAMKSIPGSFNFDTPQIRDTYYTPPATTTATWLAIRYQVVNPGPFLLHCHVQVHLNGGMGLTLMDGVDEWPEIPAEYQRLA